MWAAAGASQGAQFGIPCGRRKSPEQNIGNAQRTVCHPPLEARRELRLEPAADYACG
jgi:hypothetical protein